MSAFLTESAKKEFLIEECKKQVKLVCIPGNFRLVAEIRMEDGKMRKYTARSIDKESATKEVLTYVQALEENTGEKVFWRFKGDKTYFMSTNYHKKPSLFKRFANYFFELED